MRKKWNNKHIKACAEVIQEYDYAISIKTDWVAHNFGSECPLCESVGYKWTFDRTKYYRDCASCILGDNYGCTEDVTYWPRQYRSSMSVKQLKARRKYLIREFNKNGVDISY